MAMIPPIPTRLGPDDTDSYWHSRIEVWLDGAESELLWVEVDTVAGVGRYYSNVPMRETETVHGRFELRERIDP